MLTAYTDIHRCLSRILVIFCKSHGISCIDWIALAQCHRHSDVSVICTFLRTQQIKTLDEKHKKCFFNSEYTYTPDSVRLLGALNYISKSRTYIYPCKMRMADVHVGRCYWFCNIRVNNEHFITIYFTIIVDASDEII